jgi:hypothetical protein
MTAAKVDALAALLLIAREGTGLTRSRARGRGLSDGFETAALATGVRQPARDQLGEREHAEAVRC